ncbi:MAG: helix-hairpin-helix domain-containing protein [Anaerolineae bacterium]|jgi:competence ComEA-like helix-hairpin-helix protein
MSENDERQEEWEEAAEEESVAAEEPAAEEATEEQPVAEEPSADEAEEATEEQPVAEEPSADEAKEAILESVEETYRSPSEEEVPVLDMEEDEAKLDLNQATAEELAGLPGIGPALAERIVAYRQAEGAFREAVEITNVNGISLATYEGIADQVMVHEEGEAVVVGGPDAAVMEKEDVVPEEPPSAEEPPMPAKAEEPAMPRPRVIVERGGPGWASLLILVLLGALAGAALALGALWAYNGTLDFRAASVRAARNEVARLEGQLDAVRAELTQTGRRMEAMAGLAGRVDAAEAEMETLGRDLDSLQTDLQSAGQGLEDVRQTLAGLSDDVTNLAEGQTGLEEDVATLENQIEVVGEELVALEETVDRFDAFLEGLRALLDETTADSPVQTPARPTPTPWWTPTPTNAETAEPDVTVIPLATPTPSG